MGCNPCCCFSLKDSAVTIGIWTLVYALASMCLFGWQTGVLNHCRSVTMAQANLQCEYDCPCVGASTKRTTQIIEGLFVIQVLCLISAFFLLFASVALIYGIHTWSRYLVWPWFPCIVSSILCSLAYCIMWWAGDVRDYWLALTILEIIGVVINIYCVVVVLMYYRRITEASDQYDNKVPKNNRVVYKVNKSGYPRYEERDAHSEGRYPGRKSPYPSSYKELPQYPRPTPYDATGMPQTPIPMPPNYTPYPLDPNEVILAREPQRVVSRVVAVDPVERWVHSQQKDRNTEVNSEPISPSREVQPTQFPLQHSRSVPSMFDATLVSHRDCDHRKSGHHRSSSRHRHRSKGRYEKDTSYSSDSETRADHRRDSGRRRHKSRARYSESEMTETTMEPSRHDKKNRRKNERDRGHDDRSRRDDDVRGSSRRRHHSRDRHRSDRDEPKGGRRDRDDSDGRSSKRKHRNRKEERKHEEDNQPQAEDQGNPMSGGFAIPWNVVIPPSSGERGPDGQPLPQKLHLNTEITINYDQSKEDARLANKPNKLQNTSHSSSNQQRIENNPPYRREKYQPMQITSNV